MFVGVPEPETFAAEAGAVYDTGRGPAPRDEITAALQRVRAAAAALAAADLDGCDDRGVLDALVAAQTAENTLAAARTRLLAEAERRQAYAEDGAVTLASWYRGRARLDAGEATRRVHAARRLRALPELEAAFLAGEVTQAHVTAVTEACVPNRAAAVGEYEDILVQLARAAAPRDIRVAVGRIRDHVDPDGSDAQPLDERGKDGRRHLDLSAGIDGLGQLRGTLDQLDTEALMTVLDALDEPDPADTPSDRRRSPGQRRADALGRLAHLALDKGLGPTVHGVKPHLLLIADLVDLLDPGAAGPDVDADGRIDLTDLLVAHGLTLDDEDDGPTQGSAATTQGNEGADRRDPVATAASARDATGDHPAGPAGQAGWAGGDGGRGDRSAGPHPGEAPTSATSPSPGRTRSAQRAPRPSPPGPRLRWTGPLPYGRARRLALESKVTALLTMGPWRVTNVGRTRRVLPGWLRGALQAVHGTCRGPDCDRPVTWAEAHHQHAWDDGGETDLNATIPLCKAHHDRVTAGDWRVEFDPRTGHCTWRARDGTTKVTRPPG